MEISQNFVDFSKYINFNITLGRNNTFILWFLNLLMLLTKIMLYRNEGTREITRFSLKSLIFVFICLKDSVISLVANSSWKQNKNCFHVNIIFCQMFTRNSKNSFKYLQLIKNGTFAIVNTQPLWV